MLFYFNRNISASHMNETGCLSTDDIQPKHTSMASSSTSSRSSTLTTASILNMAVNAKEPIQMDIPRLCGHLSVHSRALQIGHVLALYLRLLAQVLHTQKCLQGRSTVSRVSVKQTMHSAPVSSSKSSSLLSGSSSTI